MYLSYPSSLNPELTLYADFAVPKVVRPILVDLHGWHGDVKSTLPPVEQTASLVDSKWFVIRPEMRGRGDAAGAPDANGWELQDIIDAVNCAKHKFRAKILDADLIALQGESGGGGNVMALLGKFPDYFCRAMARCGISDYAMWYRGDVRGEFRDELEVWIGGTPENRREAYMSRSGVSTLINLLTPVIVFHGEHDARVPVEQSRRFVEQAQHAGKADLVRYHEFKGVGGENHWDHIRSEQRAFMEREGTAFLRAELKRLIAPRRGRCVVAGYLKTKRFEVILDAIDHVAVLTYDVDAPSYVLRGPSAKTALLRTPRVDGEWQEKTILVMPPATKETAAT